MKILLTFLLLCCGALQAETATPETAPAEAVATATANMEATVTETATEPAGPTMAVIKINTSKLYVYDAELEEIGSIKASTVKKEFADLTIGAETVEGLPVLAIDDQEGLVSVMLKKYDEPVWIEMMSVELWPGNRLDCPEITVGKSEIEQSGLTMGFGDHCKQPE